MKSLTITLSLVCSLLLSANVHAAETTSVMLDNTGIETVVVISKPEPANFEVFSLSLAEEAIDNVVEIMVDSFSVSEEAASLIDLATSVGS